jgi:hypothetical protein
MAQALRFSFEGSRGVGRPKVGTDWCGNVKSITEQIQHTLNIAKVTAQAGQPALRRVAPRRSPASLDAVRSQPGWTHRMMTMTSRRWRWVSARAVLTNLWLTALNQLQPTYVRCRKASRAGSQTACLIKAGTLLNIWLYFHHGTREVLGVESSVCWIYGWTRRLTVPAGACTHACMRGSG